jgi:hypothetical protein
MEQDHEVEAKRRKQSVGPRDAGKSDEAGKSARKHIDRERRYKAIRFLKAHPEKQVRQLCIFDGLPPCAMPTASTGNITSDRCPRTRQ